MSLAVEPTHSAEEHAKREADWVRGAWVCGLWLVGGAVILGAAQTVEVAPSLTYFNARELVGRVVALSMVRGLAAGVVGNAAWLGATSATKDGRAFSGTAFVGAAALYPFPVLLGLIASGALSALCFGVTPSEFLNGVQKGLTPSDFGAGIARTLAYLLGLRATAMLLPVLALQRLSPAYRRIVTWLIGCVAMHLVRLAFDLVSMAF